jgi:hypothetical protein
MVIRYPQPPAADDRRRRQGHQATLERIFGGINSLVQAAQTKAGG